MGFTDTIWVESRFFFKLEPQGVCIKGHKATLQKKVVRIFLWEDFFLFSSHLAN